uniref:Uncharacterized protein n=1 Tax=Setaria italica TaxID=4555 RepID=K3YKF1_SETIT
MAHNFSPQDLNQPPPSNSTPRLFLINPTRATTTTAEQVRSLPTLSILASNESRARTSAARHGHAARTRAPSCGEAPTPQGDIFHPRKFRHKSESRLMV